MRTSLKYRAHWVFVQPRLVWGTIIVLGVALVLAFWPPLSEQRMLIAGWLLQIAGLGTVAQGIRQVRKQFGQGTLLEAVKKWWGRRDGVVHLAAGGLVAGSATVTGAGLVSRRPAETLEERVTYLERDLAQLASRVEAGVSDLRKELTASKDAIAFEARQREKETSELKSNMKLFATGGLYVSVMGLVWLAFGITLATIPTEILALFEWARCAV